MIIEIMMTLTDSLRTSVVEQCIVKEHAVSTEFS